MFESIDPSKHRVKPVVERLLSAVERYRALQDRFLTRFKKHIGLIDAVSWQAQDFDVDVAIANVEGPAIEVAGPTLSGFHMLSREKVTAAGKDYYVSNVYDGLYEMLSWEPPRFAKTASVDFVADAQSLPFADASVGLIFASCLPIDIRKGTIREAARVLELGGLLLWQATFIDDFKDAQAAGFELVAYEWEMPTKVLRHIEGNISDIYALQEIVFKSAQKEGLATNEGMGVEENKHMYAPRHCIFRKVRLG